MSNDAVSTRRAFLKGGAVLAAPLAAVTPAMAVDDGTARRLARLEDEAAIRSLHQGWWRDARGGTAPRALDRGQARGGVIRAIAADEADAMPVIAIAADGQHASGRLACTVQIERRLEQDCTLAQMAVAQGGGVVRSAEPGLLETAYVKRGGACTIAVTRLTLA
jgi:hypothetical protein